MIFQPGIAILCGPTGIVVDVLHDELGLIGHFQRGVSLTAIVGPEPEAVRLLREIRENELALDFELDIGLTGTDLSLFISGFRTERGIQLIGTTEPLTRESLFHELTGQQVSNSGPESKVVFSRDALLAITAHDLRNHLNGILAADQYLLVDAAASLEAEHVTLLRAIESSSQAMFRLIDDVLEVSTMQSASTRLDLKSTDILTLIGKSLSLNQREADRKKVRLEFAPPEAVPPIEVDPLRINRVMNSLLTTSIDLSTAGGTIRISVAAQDERVVISVRAMKTVLSPDAFRSIFDPNYRGIEGLSGKARTALAFELMSWIMEEHGGEIRVESDADSALKTTLTLPISAHRAEPMTKSHQG